jgi:hypothetical protein
VLPDKDEHRKDAAGRVLKKTGKKVKQGDLFFQERCCLSYRSGTSLPLIKFAFPHIGRRVCLNKDQNNNSGCAGISSPVLVVSGEGIHDDCKIMAQTHGEISVKDPEGKRGRQEKCQGFFSDKHSSAAYLTGKFRESSCLIVQSHLIHL